MPILYIRKAEGLVTSLGCLDRSRRQIFLEKKVYFPIIEDCLTKLNKYLDKIHGTVDKFDSFPVKKTQLRSLRELEKKYGLEMPKSINLIGDIATINELPPTSHNHSEKIGEIIRIEYGVRAVFLKLGEISGVTRVAKWRKLSGIGTTFTVHRENNLYFACDVSKAFFNPRLGNERYRVISNIEKGETVVDLFAGVGPFSLPIAKKCAHVYSFDINCEAIELLRINIQINSVPLDKIFFKCEDAKNAPKIVKRPVDHVIMNYPEGALNFLETALKLFGKRGIIHFYIFARGEKPKDALELVTEEVKELIANNGFKLEIIFSKINKEVAPRKYLVILDLNVIRR